MNKVEVLRQKLLFESERHERGRALLQEAKRVAARLANDPTSAASLTRFDELYYADPIGVERLEGPVETAMVQFRKKLKGEKDGPADTLDRLSLALSTAVETELKAGEDGLLEQHRAIAKRLTAPATAGSSVSVGAGEPRQ